MKKAVSSFLAASALLAAPGVFSQFATGFAQDAAAAPAAGQIQMDPGEYTDYDNAFNKQTTPATQAPALEAYLAKYPKTSVKSAALHALLTDYTQLQNFPKAISTADQVLQLAPTDFQALTVEAIFRAQLAGAATDPATKQSGMDAAAGYAQKALTAPKPDGVADDVFKTQQASVLPTFYDEIGNDDLLKKDYPDAIVAFKTELAAVPVASTQAVGLPLQDTFLLGQAYYLSTPPDYIDCTFYTTRAAQFAPEPYKTQFQGVATYCYKKYHGKAEGYDTVVAAAKANLNPPAGFSITPAPTDADIVTQTIASTPDLATLAIQDKEYILTYGTPEQADKVFATVKGKEDKIPDATVISATPETLTVAYSDDAVQSKTADFTFKMGTPLKVLPEVGKKVTLIGVWDSYTQKPLNIVMSGGELYKAPVAKKPVPRRR